MNEKHENTPGLRESAGRAARSNYSLSRGLNHLTVGGGVSTPREPKNLTYVNYKRYVLVFRFVINSFKYYTRRGVET
ncbi:MAG: hypothetical protein IJL25_03565, partial [Clostridia bacterium]|nr:hypothetical protein [Clostridia bacterium]